MRSIILLMIVFSLAGCKSDYEICIDEVAEGLVGVKPFGIGEPYTEKSARSAAAQRCASYMEK